MPLPAKMIQGWSVRDYAYQWISGDCPIHQWDSGAKGIDDKLIAFVEKLIPRTDGVDKDGLTELLAYLKANNGAPAEPYIPDQWGFDEPTATRYEEIAAGVGDIIPNPKPRPKCSCGKCSYCIDAT